MKQRRAAAPYAKALLALAMERKETELVGRQPDLRDFLAPAVDPGTGEADGGHGGRAAIQSRVGRES